MLPSLEEILSKSMAIPQHPVAIEALWDGDSNGWFVVLTALLEEPGTGPRRYREFDLASLRGEGGDMRILNAQVPPWPEAELAFRAGLQIAARLDVPFYFPSPHHPDDDCPRWWEREEGIPCGRCGIPHLHRGSSPWRGVCYPCHLILEREKKIEG